MKVISKNFKRGAVGAVFGGSLLFTAGLGIAGAEPAPAPSPTPTPAPAPAPKPDGLVNVTQGSTTVVSNVPAAVAASAVAQLCGSVPLTGDVTALVTEVDTQGVNQTACAGLPAGDVVIAQNASTASPTFPGTGAAEQSVDPNKKPAATVPPGSAGSTEGDLTGAGAAEPPSTEGEASSSGTQAPAMVEGGR